MNKPDKRYTFHFGDYDRPEVEEVIVESIKPTLIQESPSVDTLWQFLTQSDWTDREGRRRQIVIGPEDEERWMTMRELEQKYKNYCQWTRCKPNWSSSNHNTLARLGLVVKTVNICKSCSLKAQVGCCQEYSTANRVKKQIVQGLSIS